MELLDLLYERLNTLIAEANKAELIALRNGNDAKECIEYGAKYGYRRAQQEIMRIKLEKLEGKEDSDG